MDAYSQYHDREARRLYVDVPRAIDPAPERLGWKPFFVRVNLDATPQKVVIYRPVEDTWPVDEPSDDDPCKCGAPFSAHGEDGEVGEVPCVEIERSTVERLEALRHPGKTADINGVHVKRQAFRFLLDGREHAYTVEAARFYIDG